jgi:hypothetical protein
MTQGAVSRRDALKAIGAGAGAMVALPWLSDEALAAFAEIQAARPAPVLKVLTASQYATLESLVEAIIPADDRSPGAKEARVADYLDLVLAEAQVPLREQWLDGLAALDAESSRRFNVPFIALDASQTEELLGEISAYERSKGKPDEAGLQIARNEQPTEKAALVESLLGDVSRLDRAKRRTPLEEFFAVTKRATIQGYYTSEIGIHQELRYKGNQMLAEFVGCETQDGRDCPRCGQKAES